jgi:hypothetical protein
MYLYTNVEGREMLSQPFFGGGEGYSKTMNVKIHNKIDSAEKMLLKQITHYNWHLSRQAFTKVWEREVSPHQDNLNL